MRKIAFKEDVRLAGLKPEMLVALDVCADIFNDHGSQFVVTSTVEGSHSPHSHHYKGLAIDIRKWGVDGDVFTKKIQDALGSRYQVIHESTHIHVEFDPVDAAPAP